MIERVVLFMAFVERKRWLFLGLPFTFTKYTVKDDVITINILCLTTKLPILSPKFFIFTPPKLTIGHFL